MISKACGNPVVASSSLMLCRSKNAEKKIRAYILINIDNNNENKG